MSWWDRYLANLCGVALLLLPFSSVPWYGETMGELSREGWVGPGLVATGLWLFGSLWRGRVVWPRAPGAMLLVAWMLWALVGALVNVLVAGVVTFKGRSIFEKASLQAVVVLFVTTVAFAAYCGARAGKANATLSWLRRVVVLSAIAPLAVAIAEVVWLLTGSTGAQVAVRSFSRLVHSVTEYGERVRSVSGEASWFGIWLGFVVPWLISDAIRLRPVGLGGFAAAVVAAAFTFSRFTWAVTGFVSAGFIASRSGAGRVSRLAGVALALAVVAGAGAVWIAQPERARALLGSFTLAQETPYWVSNVSRVGMQVAAVKMALGSPLLGVGLGGFGFRVAEFVPEWALVSPEVQVWLVDVQGTPWPPVHGLWARLAAETGFVGLALFGAAWAAFLRSAWWRAKKCQDGGERELADLWLAVFWSGVNCLLVGLAFDSLRFGGYWLLLGVGWAAMLAEHRTGSKKGWSVGMPVWRSGGTQCTFQAPDR